MKRTGWVMTIVIFCFFWNTALHAQNAPESHLKDRVDYLIWPEYPFKQDTAVVIKKRASADPLCFELTIHSYS